MGAKGMVSSVGGTQTGTKKLAIAGTYVRRIGDAGFLHCWVIGSAYLERTDFLIIKQ